MKSLAPVDLSTESGAREWIEAGLAAFGGIDILYNNASALRNGPFDTQPVEDWYFTIRNELDIPYFCTRAAWPHLIARGGGSSSTWPPWPPYAGRPSCRWCRTGPPRAGCWR